MEVREAKSSYDVPFNIEDNTKQNEWKNEQKAQKTEEMHKTHHTSLIRRCIKHDRSSGVHIPPSVKCLLMLRCCNRAL